MTKEYCDNPGCEKEIPFSGWVRLNPISGYICLSNCLTSNPQSITYKELIFCCKDCAIQGFPKYLEDAWKPIKNY